MPLFFLLSGIVAHNSRPTYKKIFTRLYVPFVCWSVIASLYELICTPALVKSILFGNGFRTLVGYGIAPFWFLWALAIAQMTYLWCSRRACKPETVLGIGFVLSVAAAFVYTQWLSGGEGYLDLCIRTVCRQLVCTTFYYTGVLLAKYQHILTVKNRALQFAVMCFCGAVSLATALINTGVNLHKFILGNPLLFYVGAILGSYAIWSLAGVIGHCKLLESMGKCSMGIMCFHYKTIPLWGAVAWLLAGVDAWNSLVGLMLRLCLLTGVAFVLTKLTERIAPWLIGKEQNRGRTQLQDPAKGI